MLVWVVELRESLPSSAWFQYRSQLQSPEYLDQQLLPSICHYCNIGRIPNYCSAAYSCLGWQGLRVGLPLNCCDQTQAKTFYETTSITKPRLISIPCRPLDNNNVEGKAARKRARTPGLADQSSDCPTSSYACSTNLVFACVQRWDYDLHVMPFCRAIVTCGSLKFPKPTIHYTIRRYRPAALSLPIS